MPKGHTAAPILTLCVLWMTSPPSLTQELFRETTVEFHQLGPIALGSLDSDDYPDMVVRSATSLQAFLNDGTGSFVEGALLPNSRDLAEVVLGDANADGRLDVFTTGTETDEFVVYLGEGPGRFSNPRRYATDEFPIHVAVGDLDHDGSPEAVVTCFDSAALNLFANEGDGRFQNRQTISVLSRPRDITLADVDGDGHLDVLWTHMYPNPTLGVLLGQGDLSFAPMQTFTIGETPRSLEVGDANADGIVDAVIGLGESFEDYVLVLPGQGDGSFGNPYPVPVGGRHPVDIRLADLNEDGVVDLIAALSADDRVSVLYGRTDGSFQSPILHGSGDNPLELGIADLDRDGDLDIATADLSEDVLTISWGMGRETFGPHFTVADAPLDVATGDFNGDGELDLVTSAPGQSTVSVCLGTGEGTFGAPIVSGAGLHPGDLCVGDFDEDGLLDVVAINDRFPLIPQRDDAYSFLKGRGDGSFAAPRTTIVMPNASNVHATDFDLDGHLDIAFMMGDSARAYALYGNGQGSFSSAILIGTSGSPGAMTLSDIDADTLQDVVIHTGSHIGVYVNRGDRSFEPLRRSPAGTNNSAGRLASADLDGDGWMDVAILDTVGVHVASGFGDGFFGESALLPIEGLGPGEVYVGDLDGDGKADLAASGIGSYSFGAQPHAWVWLGDGQGGFPISDRVRLSGQTGLGTLADFDRDGIDDFAICVSDQDLTIWGPRHVTVLLSQRGPWRNLGEALAGGTTAPTFRSWGSLQAGTSVWHRLDGALPSTTAWLALGHSRLDIPFAGGTFVPFPQLLLALVTDSNGKIEIEATFPDLPSGTELFYQCWIPDPTAAHGFSSSNALRGTTR